MTPAGVPRSVQVRTRVVEAAVELFDERGYEATSVDDLARAAGLSRSTYFRQVGGKEDAVFADHPHLIEELGAWMDGQDTDPWATVCAASERVFAHLSADLDLARRRYAAVRGVRALRDREIITERGYERLFSDFLRRTVPGLEAVEAIGFAALVTATHNYYLRQAVRATEGSDADPAAPGAGDGHAGVTSPARPRPDDTGRQAAVLAAALDRVRSRFAVGAEGAGEGCASSGNQVLVASFPAAMPSGEVLRRVRQALDEGA